MASTSASSKPVICNTNYSSRSRGRSANLSCNVQFRLSGGAYHILRENVPNLSFFLRKLVYGAIKDLPLAEHDRLEVDVIQLVEELRNVHSYQSCLLKHGSYAKDYLIKLKGGLVIDRSPFHLREPPPEVSKDELGTVESIVEYRESLAGQLNEKLKRLVELKKASLPEVKKVE